MNEPVSPNDQFLQAYDNFADAIFRHCYLRISDRERAKDLTQEAFMRTWDYIARGSAIENIRAFLYRVANNLIIDEYRKKKSESLDELAEYGFDPGVDERGKIFANIAAADIRSVFGGLDHKYRQVLMMRFVDDLQPKEIASILGESENNVSVRIHRGIRQVREIVGDQGGYA